MTRKCWSRNYWTARGVVPRWQLFSIYAAVIVAGLIGFSLLSSESAKRRDQNCILFERNWIADIRSLSGTYDYVSKLTPRQTRDPLAIAVINTVPRQERTTHANHPPAYCKGDVGLKDSQIPPIPKRPPRVQALVHR